MLLRKILRDEAANFPTVGWKSVQMPHPLPVFYFFGSRSIFRAAKIKIPVPRSFLAHGNHTESLAMQATLLNISRTIVSPGKEQITFPQS